MTKSLPRLPRGPRPYYEGTVGKDVGGVGSRVSFWTWPALASGRPGLCALSDVDRCALVLLPGVRAGPRHSHNSIAIIMMIMNNIMITSKEH